MLERVQKILASAGIASRRDCEELIREGKVFVNHKRIKLGDKADFSKDIIMVSGKVIQPEKKVYFLLNKPKRYITAVYDPFERKTVMDLVKVHEKVFPVGRLDRDARGLIILTNDGEIANRIMHPKYGVNKTYVVTTREKLEDKDIEKLKKGIFIDGRKVFPKNVFVRTRNTIEITLHEGRKHIIKKMFFKLGYFITDLYRTEIANLSVKGLADRQYRELTRQELIDLRACLNMP